MRNKKFNIVVGNPPYINYGSKMGTYEFVDKRIHETYVSAGHAQYQGTLYDLYIRFIRMASDIILKNDAGVVCFVTNNSFQRALSMDGIRMAMGNEFDAVEIIDLKGNKRIKRAEDGKNVFGVMVGISILTLINGGYKQGVLYKEVPDGTVEVSDKLKWLSNECLTTNFTKLTIEKGSWFRVKSTEGIPLINQRKSKEGTVSIFKTYTQGLRQHSVNVAYDFERERLIEKIKFYMDYYNRCVSSGEVHKLQESHQRVTSVCKEFIFKEEYVQQIMYRPFLKKWSYVERWYTPRLSQQVQFYLGKPSAWSGFEYWTSPRPVGIHYSHNINIQACVLNFDGKTMVEKPYTVFCSGNYGDADILTDYHACHIENNINEEALGMFRSHYKDDSIDAADIICYVYGVLNSSKHCEINKLQLKQDYPVIPLYNFFENIRNLGKELLLLHLNYEYAEKYPLEVKIKGNSIKMVNEPPRAREYILGTSCPSRHIIYRYMHFKGLGAKNHNIESLNEFDKAFPNLPAERYSSEIIELLSKVTTISLITMDLKDKLNNYICL